MGLSFICTRCSKKHRNLDYNLAGKKVKCSCGKVVRLNAGTPEVERVFVVPEPKEDPETAATYYEPEIIEEPDHLETYPELDPLSQTFEPGKSDSFGYGNVAGQVLPSSGTFDSKRRVDHSPVPIRMVITGLLGAISALLATAYGAILTIGSFSAMDMFGTSWRMMARSGMQSSEWAIKLITVLTLIFGIAMLVAGIGQFVVSFLQFVKRRLVSYWPDGLTAMCAIGFFATAMVFTFLGFQSINNSLAAQEQAVVHARAAVQTAGNDWARESLDQAEKQLEASRDATNTMKWTLVKQVFLICAVPFLIVCISVYRMLH